MGTKAIDINKLYSSLLDTYINKSNEEYLKERKDVEVLIKGYEYDFKYKNNFIPYPDYRDEEFNKKIYSKKEFNRNKSILDISDYDKVSNNQCSQNTFSLTSNQRFIKGFLSPETPYNGLLLFHSVGTGKSCSAISIAEQYHEIYQKKVLVILSSTLVENFRKQIFDINKYDLKRNIANMCTGTKYPDMVLDKQKLDKDALDKKIKQLINEKYQFIGYKELAIKMDNIKGKIESNEVDPEKIEKKFNERLSEMFSDRLVIIDEAHNLRNPTETGKKQISKAFKTLLNHVQNVKLVLLTATPMFNNSKEIIWTLNLLLANDKRPELKESMVFDKNGDLTESGRKILIERSKGYMSYMRGENPFSFPFRLYPSINNDSNLLKTYPKKDIYGKTIPKANQIKHLEIISSNMSEYQKQVYDIMKTKIKKDDKDLDEIDDEEEENENDEKTDVNINNDLQNTMQISNIVYPNKDIKDLKSLYGSKGFDLNFKTTDKGKFQYKSNTNQFLSYNKINEFAPKIKRVLDYIIKSKGVVFVYSRYYASGITPLAIALEHIGFSKYGNSNLTQNIEVNDKFNGTKPKYIVLSRKKELSPNNDAEIALSKHKDNLKGEKIKVIIVSKIGTEGIDFKRIREIHLLEPWFNLNRAEQIIGRGVRYCSHIDLPKSERNVTIMFHAAKYNDDEESIDLRTYRVAEIKQKRITEIEKILKETSIDCNLNKDTLVYPTKKLNITFDIETSQGVKIKDFSVGDVDKSQICNYEICKAKCVPDIILNDKIDIDESTFGVKFINDDIDMYKRYISLLYLSPKISYSYEQIYKLLKKEYNIVDEEILLYALDDLVIRKNILFDSKDRTGYLIYRANLYIFQQTRFSDTRLTIEEREEYINNRKNLPLLELHSKLKPHQNTSVSKPKISNSVVDNKQVIDAIDEKYKNTLENINIVVIDSFISSFGKNQMAELIGNNIYIDNYIKNNVKEVSKKTEGSKKIINIIESVIRKLDDYIVDSVIDRLTESELLILIQHIANKYNKKIDLSQLESKYLRSLISGSIVFVNNENIKYYYNYFEDELYCLKTDGKFKKCNAIDLVKLKEYITIINNNKVLGLKGETLGYISMNNKKGIDIQFKIRDNKGPGYVCYKTSSLKIDDLKKMIKKIMPEMISEYPLIKHSKPNLCLFYEIILRAYEGDLFQRPHYVKN